MSFHPKQEYYPGKTFEEVVVEKANSAPCAKSKRGAILVRPNPKHSSILGEGHNGPPNPFCCSASDACRTSCNKVAIHAEERAILQGLPYEEFGLSGTELIHGKTVDGKLVPSGAPSCWQCSRTIVEVGVSGMWLYHEDGWKRYTAQEFHQLTLENCGLV